MSGGITTNRKHNSDLTKNAKALRKNMTKEERHLWYDFLRSYPIRFLRQKVIDNYIVDFYCHEARMIIELDGSQHYQANEMIKDKIRTQKIKNRDLTVIRIPNNEISRNFRGVCEYIDLQVKQSIRK
ncbi:MAG: endonuclease domain-containing protein [Clostridia bacterium]|nr:endonuclease domain-containing protein [Clostridia bacterium]